MARRKSLYIFPIIILVIAITGVLLRDRIYQRFFEPTETSVETGLSNVEDNSPDVSIAAQDITVPWGMAFLPGGDMLVTERPGTLKQIGRDGRSHVIQGVAHTSEGGLLGVALDPKYSENNRIYLYLTSLNGANLINRVERYVYKDGNLSGRTVILQNIPGERNHDGGRLAFGPDGFLYVTTGDAGVEQNAQMTNSLAGKILRMDTDGRPAEGNPFNNHVYSFGHRNPQGLAWDDKGQLWSTEHGPSGTGSGFDELNLIKIGSNYGWPVIKGDEKREIMINPVAHSGATDTWAPAGLAYANGKLFFGGLRGQTLYQATINDDNTVSLKGHYRTDYGRIRTTHVDGNFLYMTTSNTDGRGTPKPNDDKIVKFKISLFD